MRKYGGLAILGIGGFVVLPLVAGVVLSKVLAILGIIAVWEVIKLVAVGE